MTSRTSPRFWKAFEDLPADIKGQAREAYRLFQENPAHPGLRFKKVHPAQPIYSARISRDFRAVGVVRGDAIIWFWIGSHDNYARLLSSL